MGARGGGPGPTSASLLAGRAVCESDIDPSLAPTSMEVLKAQFVNDGLGDHFGSGPSTWRQFTFANFNQLMKVSPDLFSVWIGAMRRTPHSQLLLLTGVTNVHVQFPGASRNADAEMATRGLRISRLRKGPVRAKEHHLARAARCDLAVDTLSYNSHTTGTDSLWAGLPLLTQSGRYFAARVAGALVSNAGAPMMQVASLKEYEDQIHRLATPSSDARHAPTRVAAHTAAPVQAAVATYDANGQPMQPLSLYGTSAFPWDLAPAPSTGAEKEATGLVGPRPWGQYLRFDPSFNPATSFKYNGLTGNLEKSVKYYHVSQRARDLMAADPGYVPRVGQTA